MSGAAHGTGLMLIGHDDQEVGLAHNSPPMPAILSSLSNTSNTIRRSDSFIDPNRASWRERIAGQARIWSRSPLRVSRNRVIR